MNHNYRIAHFIETDVPGGAEKILFDICVQLKKSAHTPVLLHFGHAYFEKMCAELNIEQHIIPGHAYFKSTLKLWRFALTLRNTLKQLNIDLLHSHLFGPITGAASGAFLARIPHVGTLHDIYMIEDKPSRIRLLQLAALLRTRLVTVSESMEKFYRQRASFTKPSIRTIYNGVEIGTQYSPSELNSLRHHLNIQDDDTVIINVGRLVPLKRHDLLLHAIQTIPNDFKLLIIGDGPTHKEIENLVTELKLQDKVVLAGHRRDVDKLLAMSDIFVQCSDTEGLSMSIMEAMAASLPCVVTDVGGNYELIKHNSNGYLCKASNPEELSQFISDLLNNKNTRTKMGQRSSEYCKEKFNHELLIKNYLNLYKNCLPRKS